MREELPSSESRRPEVGLLIDARLRGDTRI
jgi:hypothetical protein